MAHLDLLFLPSSDLKTPHPPIAHLYVKEWGMHDYKGHERKILISPQCYTLKEIEEAIDNLSRDIEAIRKKARAKFER